MILATSQVASTVANLKSRYYKYLETLCTANGIDIASLKTTGADHEELEMFFGGLPVLIGLKYFDRLRVLRLFGQDIMNLKPLVEVGATLEELWVCEGPLKELAGIENCKKLQKLYLFGCMIEDGSSLSKLTGIDTLWIQNNKLKDISFLDHLQQLTILYIGGNQLNDHVARSVKNWPHKLQELDVDTNSVQSLQSLLPLSSCEVIRCLNVASDQCSELLHNEAHFAWIGFHFPYLERLNNDVVGEKFQQTQSLLAEGLLMDSYVLLVNSEKGYQQKLAVIDKGFNRVQEKLALLVATLSKMALTVPKKEGRRELVVRMQEQSQRSLKALKKVKRYCTSLEYCLHRLEDYYFPSWRLEGAMSPKWPRALDDYETRLLEQSFKWFSSLASDHTVKIHAAFYFGDQNTASSQLKRADIEQLFFMDFDRRSNNWELRSCIGLCDRRYTLDYREDAVRIFKDIAPFMNEAKDGTRFFVLPLVKSEKHYRKSRFGAFVDADEKQPEEKVEEHEEDKVGDNESDQFAVKGHMESASWQELNFALICLVEIQALGQILFEDLRNLNSFDEKFNAQIKKLKGLGIDLKLDKLQNTTNILNEASNMDTQMSDLTADDTATDKKAKSKKVEEILNADFPKDRWRRQMPLGGSKRLSLRDPLELAMTFAKPPIFVDVDDLVTTVTCLDLSGMKLTKLNGIEQMTNLMCLSLSQNKIISLKKLKNLKNLHFLDASNNNIAHFDEPPEMLSELNLASNQLTSIHFCGKLQLLVKINVNHNKIKTLKGVENAKLLEVLRTAENQIKDKSELDLFNALPKLTVLDLSSNPIVDSENYRKKIIQKCPTLLLIDCEIVPKEERQLAIRKPGKALTIDFIEKNHAHFETSKTLNLPGNGFQMVALDRQAIMRLQHVTSVDLSKNILESLHELVELENIQFLNLAENSIMTLTGIPVMQETTPAVSQLVGQQQKHAIFPVLVELDLSFNNLTNQTLSRLGLSLLPALKKVVLIGNQLTKFDMNLFDLKHLEEVDLSANEVKVIKKKTLVQLTWLNLAGNKLKELDGLSTPNLEYLDVRNNKIMTCSALKPISQMSGLKRFFCSGNAVTERRVYHDFIKNQVKSLENYDDEVIPVKTLMPDTQLHPEREATVMSGGSESSSSTNNNNNGFHQPSASTSSILVKNGVTPNTAAPVINIRIAQPERGYRQFQSHQHKAPARTTTGRPPYCPPGTSIVVNQRISHSGSCFTFFPEGNYLSQDGTLETSPSWTPLRSSYGSLPYLNEVNRPVENTKKRTEKGMYSAQIKSGRVNGGSRQKKQENPFLISGQSAIRHFR